MFVGPISVRVPTAPRKEQPGVEEDPPWLNKVESEYESKVLWKKCMARNQENSTTAQYHLYSLAHWSPESEN